jgi:hypothetical protein
VKRREFIAGLGSAAAWPTVPRAQSVAVPVIVEGQMDALPPDRAVKPGHPKALTGKERLGSKWMDDQRVDNCKVPIDKRGAKSRPDTCS